MTTMREERAENHREAHPGQLSLPDEHGIGQEAAASVRVLTRHGIG
jgi:hypothetical protein